MRTITKLLLFGLLAAGVAVPVVAQVYKDAR